MIKFFFSLFHRNYTLLKFLIITVLCKAKFSADMFSLGNLNVEAISVISNNKHTPHIATAIFLFITFL